MTVTPILTIIIVISVLDGVLLIAGVIALARSH